MKNIAFLILGLFFSLSINAQDTITVDVNLITGETTFDADCSRSSTTRLIQNDSSVGVIIILAPEYASPRLMIGDENYDPIPTPQPIDPRDIHVIPGDPETGIWNGLDSTKTTDNNHTHCNRPCSILNPINPCENHFTSGDATFDSLEKEICSIEIDIKSVENSIKQLWFLDEDGCQKLHQMSTTNRAQTLASIKKTFLEKRKDLIAAQEKLVPTLPKFEVSVSGKMKVITKISRSSLDFKDLEIDAGEQMPEIEIINNLDKD